MFASYMVVLTGCNVEFESFDASKTEYASTLKENIEEPVAPEARHFKQAPVPLGERSPICNGKPAAPKLLEQTSVVSATEDAETQDAETEIENAIFRQDNIPSPNPETNGLTTPKSPSEPPTPSINHLPELSQLANATVVLQEDTLPNEAESMALESSNAPSPDLLTQPNSTPTLQTMPQTTPQQDDFTRPGKSRSELSAGKQRIIPQVRTKQRPSPPNPTLRPELPSPTGDDAVPVSPVTQPLRPLNIHPSENNLLRRNIRENVRTCLGFYYQHSLNVAEYSPWSLMHATLAYGHDAEITMNGSRSNALQWLYENGIGNGMRLMTSNELGPLPKEGPGYQGHPGQFLAILAQCGTPPQQPIIIDEEQYVVQDLIEYEKRTCKPQTELTFKLIGLATYLDSEETWTNEYGTWNLERIVQEELQQPVKSGAACGGTHRLNGLSHALHYRKLQNKPIVGTWRSAREFVDIHVETALNLQNPNGSFSTNWFRGRGLSPDLNRQLWSTGHILEWLLFELPQDVLQQDIRIQNAADFLAKLLLEHREFNWGTGKKFHALHALRMFDESVLGRDLQNREFDFVESDLPVMKRPPISTSQPNLSRPRPLLFRRRLFGR